MQIFDSIDTPELITLIQNGGVGVLPTDTVYGLVTRANDSASVERLYRLKHREQKPGTIIAGTLEQLVGLGIRARYLKAVEQYWPNPLSVVIPCDDELSYLHQGKHSLAVRIPANATIRALLDKTGPLVTSSANQPGEPTAETVADAQAYFKETVDFYVDGGPIIDHEPSTVIRIVDDAVEVLRMGAVRINESGRIE